MTTLYTEIFGDWEYDHCIGEPSNPVSGAEEDERTPRYPGDGVPWSERPTVRKSNELH